MPAFDYDCPTITNAFIQETNRYINEVASKSIPYVPWLANTPRGNWRRELGPIQNSVVFERTVPTDTGDEWTDTVTSDGTLNACDYDPEIVRFGQSTRSMRRQKRYIQTDDFCLEDLLDDLMIEQFLRGIGRNLRGVAEYVWATRRRREYSRLAEHKVTERASIDLDTTTFDAANPPTSTLTWGTLEQIYDYMYLNGAFADGAIGKTGTGGSVIPVITSAQTIRNLLRKDSALREIFLYAYEGMGEKGPLMSAYGEGVSYNGFKFVKDYPRRFDIEGGVYVERYPYGAATAATTGVKQDLDVRYRYARYEDTPIHIPSVYRELVQVPISNPGDKFQFSPQNYMGEFEFKVIEDRKCNPFGNKGFFHGRFVSASEPGQTWHGFVVRHLSCLPQRNLRSCQEYS